MKRYRRIIFIVLLFVTCLYSSAQALNNERVFSQFQFNFTTPGARATAMGGAFIGLADDATAAVTNPAGLTQLIMPEISAEFKYSMYTTEQIYENRSSETDITRKEFDESVANVPFLSFVFPYKRFVFSLYRQEVVNYESSFRTSAYHIALPGTDWAFLPIDASVDLAVTDYGIGFAVKLFEGLSLAVSPGWAEIKMKSHSTRFRSNPTDFVRSGTISVASATLIEDEDGGFSINTGILWTPHPKVSIGAMYRRGTVFTMTEENRSQVYSLDPNSVRPNNRYDPDLAEFTLKVPDSYGAGIAFRATDFLTLALDVVHIRDEDLLKDFDILFDSEKITKDNFTVDNATEVHFGVEYILPLGKRLLALRAGVYNDPDHTVRFTGTTEDPVYELVYKELFPGGDDQIHFTGGMGLVLNERFQIDVGANIAEKSSQFSISTVYRFGGKKFQSVKPLLTRSAKSLKKTSPSIRFLVAMTDGTEGKTLEIRKITTETHGIRDVKVTVKEVEAAEFLVTAVLEKEEKRFTADIRIDIRQNEMTVEEIDSSGLVMLMKEKPDSLEFTINFMEQNIDNSDDED